jgi:integrase
MRGNVRKIRADRWLCTYYDAAGKRRARSFTRKLDADRFLASTQTDQLRGTWVDPAAGKVTVSEYAARWLAVRDLRPTTRERYESYLTFINRLSDVPLGELTTSTVREWQAGLVPHLAVSTANTVRGVFVAVLSDAVIDGKITRNPFGGVRRLKPPPAAHVVPPPASTVLGIAERINPRYRAAVIVGIGAGLRRGEAFALCVQCVDFLRRTIHVHAEHGGVIQVDGVYRLGPPKTAASVRTVPVHQAVIDALAAHMATFPPVDGLIFTTARGGIVGRGTFLKAWRAEKVGAPAGSRFHDLRHFYASALIQAGESVKVVQARLGHATAAETLDTYGHMWPDSEDSTRAALDGVFSPAPVVAKMRESSP